LKFRPFHGHIAGRKPFFKKALRFDDKQRAGLLIANPNFFERFRAVCLPKRDRGGQGR
jgi:hypothetical protein